MEFVEIGETGLFVRSTGERQSRLIVLADGIEWSDFEQLPQTRVLFFGDDVPELLKEAFISKKITRRILSDALGGKPLSPSTYKKLRKFVFG